jgi:hypothetical protein
MSLGSGADQQIRDLEAKVEVLSGDREERLELMTVLIRNLLKENADLRGMVRSMASFVGEGMLTSARSLKLILRSRFLFATLGLELGWTGRHPEPSRHGYSLRSVRSTQERQGTAKG